MPAIVDALERSRTLDRPAAIVCQTKKGRGVSSMEDRFGFHGKPPSQEQEQQAMEELEATYREQTRALEEELMTSALIEAAEPKAESIATRQPTATLSSRSARPIPRWSRSTPTWPSPPSR